jgi:type III secretion protein T
MTYDTHAWLRALMDWYDAYHTLIVLVLLTGIRIMVAFIVLPATGDTALPGTVRNGVVYVLAFFVAAGQSPQAFETAGSAQLVVLACKEAFLGLAFGFAAAPVFWIAQSVGTLIDDLAGFNNIQMTDPLRGMIGMIMLIALVAVFASQVVGDVLLGDLGNQLAKGMLGGPAQ